MPIETEAKSGYERLTALAGEIFDHWSEDNAPRMAAALAYYAILSAAPLLVVSLAVAGLIFGSQAARGELAWEIQNFVGGQAAQAIQAVIGNARHPASGWISTGLSIVTLIAGASSVVVELRSALNKIWKVPQTDAGNWLGNVILFLKQRFYSAVIVIGAGCLLLVSLMVSVAITTVSELFRPLLPMPDWALHLITIGGSFVVVTLVFGAIYKLLPDVHLRWSDVIIGASVTSVLFTIGKQLLAIYLAHETFRSTYGAAWTLVLLLVWVYYSAQLFFLGAEFTKVYASRYGSQRSVPGAAPRPERSATRRAGSHRDRQRN